jgi:hypothetical protein
LGIAQTVNWSRNGHSVPISLRPGFAGSLEGKPERLVASLCPVASMLGVFASVQRSQRPQRVDTVFRCYGAAHTTRLGVDDLIEACHLPGAISHGLFPKPTVTILRRVQNPTPRKPARVIRATMRAPRLSATRINPIASKRRTRGEDVVTSAPSGLAANVNSSMSAPLILNATLRSSGSRLHVARSGATLI